MKEDAVSCLWLLVADFQMKKMLAFVRERIMKAWSLHLALTRNISKHGKVLAHNLCLSEVACCYRSDKKKFGLRLEKHWEQKFLVWERMKIVITIIGFCLFADYYVESQGLPSCHESE